MTINEENTSTTETTESTTTATPDAPDTSSTTDAPDAPDTENAGAKAASTEVPAYVPNLKFKVKDKELEFEPWVKDAVKDAETEKKIREMHEKAYGLDEVKTHRETIQTQLKEVTAKHQRLEGSVNMLGQLAKQKRYNEFFQALAIPENDILGYAVEVLKYRELPPEQKRQIEMQRERDQQLQALEAETHQSHTQMQQMAQEYKQNELNFVMSRPDVSEVAKNYDARVGQPGAFMKEVIGRGAYHEAVSKTVITAEQAVNEVLQLLGSGAGNASASGINPSPQAQQGGVVTQVQKPTISAFAGQGGRSPAKKVFTRIDDIRKHAQQRPAE